MQTRFTPEALAEPDIARADEILRRCVHCGFCTATCPTYRLTGDELDGPRGRIYLIKNLLEDDQPTDDATRRHLDRCLGCLSCNTTCPADVAYGELLYIARSRQADAVSPTSPRRLLRRALVGLVTRPRLLRAALTLGRAGHGLRALLPRALRPLAEVAHAAAPVPERCRDPAGDVPERRGLVLLHPGCVQRAAGAHVNAAAQRLLQRAGYAVMAPAGAGCCAAMPAHLGETAQARRMARANLDAWQDALDAPDLVGIVSTASGCSGSLREQGSLAGADDRVAAQIAGLAMDLGTLLERLELPPMQRPEALPPLAWHAPCSLQHGSRSDGAARSLLERAGFELGTPRDAHLCCGAAGTYNLLQPDFAEPLGRARADALERSAPGPIVSANLGCMLQLRRFSARRVVHYVELLDWASGGPRPPGLSAGD
jgi:glycolate oxidase iron-sulfur subunit